MIIPTCSASRFHVIMMIVWVILGYPTVRYWHSSILWVSVMSLYSIIVGHWGAYQAARAEESNA